LPQHQLDKSVYVIILNYNGRRWLEACLGSLRGTAYGNYSVLLVDNDSTDDSLELVREKFPDVGMLLNESNLGFSEGNNHGINQALERGADYVVLLNPDTIIEPDWLNRLIEAGESDSSIGILGAVQLNYDGTDFNTWTATAVPELMDELRNPVRPWIPVEWVEGACMAIKREVIERVGMLDPIYFAFYEEIDLCRRARFAGYQVALVPGSRIRHYRGGMWQADAARSRERDYRCDRSQFIYNLTDPRNTFTRNLAGYLRTLLTKSNEIRKDFNFNRLWDLTRMQIDLMANFGRLIGKWQHDRGIRKK